jgi:DNA-binding transcriptional MerR regulator
MTTLRIAEVTGRTGVPATTLRYYEDIGLLTAGRSGNGYRAYAERDVERLRFITSAKQLDISLDDLRELLPAWDGGACADVQAQLAQVVTTRLAQTRERVVALNELAEHLQSAAARLSAPAAAGPCHPGCACSTASEPASELASEPASQPAAAQPAAAQPAAAQSAAGSVRSRAVSIEITRPAPIACTLGAGQVGGRVAEWNAVLARALDRTRIPGGVALSFAPDPGTTSELARLAAAEHACCTFFDFTLAVTGAGVRLEVRAPSEAQDLLVALFGPAGNDFRRPTGPGTSKP